MDYRNKIKPFSTLVEELAQLRSEGKSVALCHGVFDLVHIGHIRHLREAKEHADFLIVTVTANQYVNKGPGRPVFDQELRAESLAALDVVDYVAISDWPHAVEILKQLKPDFYVKGPDYRDHSKDHSGGIILEQEAVEAGGGKLIYTQDITSSSSKLLNEFYSPFPEEVQHYLHGFSQRYSSQDLEEAFQRIANLKVLIVGEAIIDEYIYCEAIGKSGKEPMLAVKSLKSEKFAGGTLAVANHMADFCNKVSLLTFLGDHQSQEEWIRSQLDERIDTQFLYRKNSPTILKRRFVEHYFFTKLLALYELNDGALSKEDEELLLAKLGRYIGEYDLILVVDYGHSLMSPRAIEVVSEQAPFLAVNAQSNAGNRGFHTISTYPRMHFGCLTEGEIRQEVRDRRGDLHEIVQEVAVKLHQPTLIVTRGSKGSLCYSETEGFIEIPALSKKVVDRMGAGDTFLSLAAPALTAGLPLEIAGFLGNIAGAQAVATVGHRRSLKRSSLLKSIQALLK